jgi:N-acetylglucosamine-6-phosphate deacetylase
LVLTTDAIAAAGMPDGGYTIGSIEVTVSDGEVRNQAGDLAGSAITMDRELAVFAETTGSPFGTAVKAVTLNPSEAVGRWDLGRLRPGARGDLTLLDGTMVAATVVGGQVSFLHEPDRWMQRF